MTSQRRRERTKRAAKTGSEVDRAASKTGQGICRDERGQEQPADKQRALRNR